MEETFEAVKQAIAEKRMRLAIVKPKARRLLTWPTSGDRRWVQTSRLWFSRALGMLFIISSLAAAYSWMTWELMHMIFACTLSLVSLWYLDRIAAHHVQELAMTDPAFFHAGRESGLIELEPMTLPGSGSASRASAD